MKPADRYAWIEQYLRENAGAVDVLNREFVEAYTEDTDTKFHAVAWGADKCPQLGRDLAKMTKARRLKRWRSGLAGNWQPGFPTWVWSYELQKV
jgi:hypothetical protein